MPPKRRLERENENNNKLQRLDQMQTDHELFLQAFEKPTQIYRYLRTRSFTSPSFLPRTLSYMKNRMSRRHTKSRKDFKVDGILEKVSAIRKQETDPHCSSNFMNLIFNGFYEKVQATPSNDTVIVEISLLKLCHKKRKDVASPVMEVLVGQCRVSLNPDQRNHSLTASSVSVPTSHFHFNTRHLVKSYVLLFRTTSVSKENSNDLCNNHTSDSEDEPLSKRIRNGRDNEDEEEERVYGAELVIFDKHQRCLLTDGDYELVLQEVLIPKSSGKNSSWETVDDLDKSLDQFGVFKMSPTLRFNLQWSNSIISSEIPVPMTALVRPSGNLYVDNSRINNCSTINRQDFNDKKRKPKIFYQFLYNNNTRQQTEAREDLHCPWCSLNCMRLYSLLKHLKLCHSRFLFTYVPHPKGARVDVAINDCYDGSYAGNPHDLLAFPPGFAFSRIGPVRRTPVTTVIVCRPKRLPPSLSEFLEADESEYDGIRPYIIGHNRLYHHSGTCLPVRPQEIEIDSEGENDPEWLQIKTKRMIDEFTDVNEGEKELMKLWNLHVMKYGFVGDSQIPSACRMFVNLHGREILSKKLYRNFVLHMCNLLDFELIGASTLYQVTRQLLMLLKSDDKRENEKLREEKKTSSTYSIKHRCGAIAMRNVIGAAQVILNGQR